MKKESNSHPTCWFCFFLLACNFIFIVWGLCGGVDFSGERQKRADHLQDRSKGYEEKSDSHEADYFLLPHYKLWCLSDHPIPIAGSNSSVLESFENIKDFPSNKPSAGGREDNADNIEP